MEFRLHKSIEYLQEEIVEKKLFVWRRTNFLCFSSKSFFVLVKLSTDLKFMDSYSILISSQQIEDSKTLLSVFLFQVLSILPMGNSICERKIYNFLPGPVKTRCEMEKKKRKFKISSIVRLATALRSWFPIPDSRWAR